MPGTKKDQKVVTNIITNNNINTFIINDPNIAANPNNPAALQNLTAAAMNGAAGSSAN